MTSRLDDEKRKSICSIAPDMHFYNVHLMKDCCIIPYTFYLEYGYTPIFVTTKCDEYKYLEKMPGAIMEFLEYARTPLEWTDRCKEFLENRHNEIDILFCFGPYLIYTELVPLYKSLRPNGKVIMKLDASLYWMDKIPFENPAYKKLFECCDFISCETKKVKKYLATKWPYIIEYVPNGFLKDFYTEPEGVDKKENVIMTVAEIGREEKMHYVLMEAFGIASEKLSDWKLKMVGPIKNGFEEYIEAFFVRYPGLKDRVIFTGAVTDKAILYQEYSRAKIFALTSLTEGFPNVLSEAIYNGCYIVCSEIDCAEDITKSGLIGKIFPIGDIERLADILIDVCDEKKDKVIKKSYYEVRKFWDDTFDYRKIVRKIGFLLGI